MTTNRPTAYEIWAHSEGIKEKQLTEDPLTLVWLGVTTSGAALFSPLLLLTAGRKQRLWEDYQNALLSGDDELIETTLRAWARANGIRTPAK